MNEVSWTGRLGVEPLRHKWTFTFYFLILKNENSRVQQGPENERSSIVLNTLKYTDSRIRKTSKRRVTVVDARHRTRETRSSGVDRVSWNTVYMYLPSPFIDIYFVRFLDRMYNTDMHEGVMFLELSL